MIIGRSYACGFAVISKIWKQLYEPNLTRNAFSVQNLPDGLKFVIENAYSWWFKSTPDLFFLAQLLRPFHFYLCKLSLRQILKESEIVWYLQKANGQPKCTSRLSSELKVLLALQKYLSWFSDCTISKTLYENLFGKEFHYHKKRAVGVFDSTPKQSQTAYWVLKN